jgi:hypothetical protein
MKYKVLCLYRNGELYESIEYNTYYLATTEIQLLREHNKYVNDGIKKLSLVKVGEKKNEN